MNIDFEELEQAADEFEKQARQVRFAREAHEQRHFDGNSSAGRVSATCTGNGSIINLSIQPRSLDTNRPEAIGSEIQEAILNARSAASNAGHEALRQVSPEFC